MKIISQLSAAFSEYANDIRTYMHKMFPEMNEKFSNASVFGQLMTVISASVQNVMLYLEDSITEQNKYTAQRKKSVYGLAAMTGFYPSLGSASGITFTMSFIPNNVNSLTYAIKNHTKLMCSQNGLTYNILIPQETLVFNTTRDNSSKSLFAVEGKFEQQTFIADGGKMYSINVTFNGDSDITYLEVRVNDELYTRAESLYDMAPDGKQYVCHTSLERGYDIIFGNDMHGRALNANDKIDVRYLIHNGEAGNINYNEPFSLTFIDSIVDSAQNEIDANDVFNINVSKDSANNGTYSDSTMFVKEHIGYNSRAMVLANAQNYKTFIDRFSFCGYNRTFSEEGSLVINSIIMKNYRSQMNEGREYFALQERDFKLSDAQKQTIKDAIRISGQQLAGTILNIFDVKLAKYAAYIYVKMRDVSYDKHQIEEQIHNVIGLFMSQLDNDVFVAKSDLIYELKNNISSIDSVDIYFISERNERALIEKQYTQETYVYDTNTKTYNINTRVYKLEDDEDAGLGLDAHGNIYLDDNFTFPVLMGGWQYRSSQSLLENQETTVNDPLIIIFE